MKTRLFGSSGIRRIADDQLVKIAFEAGLAVGARYRNVVIGGDTRTSTDIIKAALFSGIQASGNICQDAGLLPTPTLAYVARHFNAGLMVTASHNPPEYNGIKFWNPDGAAFDDTQERQVEASIESTDIPADVGHDSATAPQCGGAIDEHIDRILRDFPGSLRGLKVVVDCGGGAASVTTPKLMKQLGIDPILVYCRPSGVFPRASEPTDENLAELKRKVVESGAQVGLAHDGDADRLVVVNENGQVISGDKLMVILAHRLNAKEVVTTVDASMVIEESGLIARRTRVGDSAVSAELKRTGAQFGGEPCGAWIFPKVSYCPDGIYAAALVSTLAAEGSLAKLAGEIPSYPMIRGSLSFETPPHIDDLEPGLLALDHVDIERIDGLRLRLKNGWVLIRLSGTEPKLRLTVEADSWNGAVEIFEKAKQSIKAVMPCG
ncbi:phosphoglucosamine mutase [Dehalogenimonas formicexedens]|uniref:Phosphoglucosamine mutase n=1 Tax=Dehalogenimonas formicexedens TaxID=1839801 RepID=A0A1P8F9J3_9CHLR|nr:phosphoglucosamine mutase [Dehalogenimonas formicexedens]